MNWKILVLTFALFLVTNLTAQNTIKFNGYYIEIIGKLHFASGQYIVNEKELKGIVQNPHQYIYGEKSKQLKPLFNYTSTMLQTLKNASDTLVNIDQDTLKTIDWNYKVSLYRGNDYLENSLYLCKSDTNYAFYIKKVSIICDEVQLPPKVVINSDDSPFFSISNDKIYLLRKILSQSKLSMSSPIINQFISYLNPLETCLKWHPCLGNSVKVYVDGKYYRTEYNYPNW